jgi:hypothetical protein
VDIQGDARPWREARLLHHPDGRQEAQGTERVVSARIRLSHRQISTTQAGGPIAIRMNEDKQIRTIAAACRTAPKQIGVFVDDYKVERYIKKLREYLFEEEFIIEIHGPPVIGLKVKTLIIKRKIQNDIANN